MQGILLVNLGTPDSTSIPDVRKYLDEFLMDEYVIDLPRWARALLVRGIVLRTRPPKTAAAYQSIWYDSGSPLLVNTQALADKLKSEPIEIGMRYGNPSIKAGLDSLINRYPEITSIKIIPLYPQYAMATTKTVEVAVKKVIDQYYPDLAISYVPPFYNQPDYIAALAYSIQAHLTPTTEFTLFSYHGIPERHVKKTDPTKTHCLKVKDCCNTQNSSAQAVCYPYQAKKTTALVAQRLGLGPDQWGVSFQSRFGLDKWLSPATDSEIKRLAQSGIKHLAICCPAFISDCLETLEEIGEEGREIFLENGGQTYTLIPCLNDDDRLAQCLLRLAKTP